MAQEDLFAEFIKKLQKDKTPEEMGKFLADLLKFSSAQLYVAIMTFLTDKDCEEIEKLSSEKEIEEEIKKRFKLRTGLTSEEFIAKLRDQVAQGYLFPELAPKQAPQALAK